MQTLSLIFSTFVLRPYVLIFLLLFLAGSLKVFGWKRTVLFIAYAYPLSFLLEVCSTRFGFPFGIYIYHPLDTVGRELWVLDIPWMSTLSFVFLSFFSYRLSVYFFTRAPFSWPFTAAFFMFLVDFVIDPVTLQGRRWFLGDLYHYPEAGFYFGVPFSNFLGWALTGFLVSFPFAVEELLKKRELEHWKKYWRWDFFLSWVYVGAILFMAAVAFSIGEDRLGIVGASIGAAVGLGLAFRRKFLLNQEQRIKEPAV